MVLKMQATSEYWTFAQNFLERTIENTLQLECICIMKITKSRSFVNNTSEWKTD